MKEREKEREMDKRNKYIVNTVDLFKDMFFEKCRVCVYIYYVRNKT